MNKKVYIGFITNFFGLKGEVKVLSDINLSDVIFKKGSIFYITGEKYIVKSVRKHKNNYLVLFEGFEDINKIDHLIKKEIFIDKNDYSFSKDDYLISELYDLDIIFSNEVIGKVKDILISKEDVYIKCDNLIIPLIDKYLDYVDVDNNKIYVKDVKELML